MGRNTRTRMGGCTGRGERGENLCSLATIPASQARSYRLGAPVNLVVGPPSLQG